MKGDFTRFTHDARKHYTRVLKQQGRVDLDADWNEQVEIFTQRDRKEAIDVIGRCGVPKEGGGFRISLTADGTDLEIAPGRIWVDGILAELEASDVRLTNQTDLPGYEPELPDGNYLVYLDVWDRHITVLEDPDIREVALGGPDTTTRTRTAAQVRVLLLEESGSLETLACRSYPGATPTGTVQAQVDPEEDPANPCIVPAAGGYRGIENRLYRVEIHESGLDETGAPTGTPTFVWSRDNGAVVLPIVAIGVGGDAKKVQLRRLGLDEVLTVRTGDWVEILGDKTELYGRPGTLAQIEPDGIDTTDLTITLDRSVSVHAGETHLKVRRWDHQGTTEVALTLTGALPISADWFELEDGVQVRFDTAATYHVGDYWLIPARVNEGGILWPTAGTPAAPVARLRLGIEHHYCTLALARREAGIWVDERDCRREFPPLVDVGPSGCCVSVQPGENVQQAIDTVIAAGGGRVCLCAGVHEIAGPLWIRGADSFVLEGQGDASILRWQSIDALGGVIIERSRAVVVSDACLVAHDLPALITLRHGEDREPNRRIALRRLALLNLTAIRHRNRLPCGVWMAHSDGVVIQECRVAAPAGVVSVWGNAIPDSTPAADEGDEGNPDATTVSFEELPPDLEIRVGGTATDGGVTLTGEPFTWGNGVETSDGFAKVQSANWAGGSGQEMLFNNINLAFGLPAPYRTARLVFGEFGGNNNLWINGVLSNVTDFSSLHGLTIGGVRIAVEMDQVTGGAQGTISLEADPDPIRTFAIGGQEFAVAEVSFSDADTDDDEIPAPVFIGSGVADLWMHETRIRFREVGLFALRADRWRVDGCNIGSIDDDAWENLVSLLPEKDEGGMVPRQAYVSLLAEFERLCTSPSTGELRGTGLLAFLWRDCALADSTLAGARGAWVLWWIRGAVDACSVRSEESGLFALWFYDATWSRNRIVAPEGGALAWGGVCAARIEDNRVSAQTGLGTDSDSQGVAGWRTLIEATTRLLAQAGGNDPATVCWVMLEESVDLMGLRSLVDALGQVLAELIVEQRVLYLIATVITPRLFDDDATQAKIVLPVIDLRVDGNDLFCDRSCVLLQEIISLGGLRITENHLHTTTGQALRVDANEMFANPYLVVMFIRVAFDLLIDRLEQVVDEADEGSMKVLLAEALRLLTVWRTGAERFAETDLRIQDNMIRSLATAVESNLFGLAIVGNHITMYEGEAQEKVGTIATDDDVAEVFRANSEAPRVVAVMQKDEVLEPLAVGLRDGVRVDPQLYSAELLREDGVLAEASTRVSTAATIAVIASETTNVELAETGGHLDDALRADNRDELVKLLPQFITLLQKYIASQGILVKGVGCRILDNQVLAPAGSDPESQALGGIEVSVDLSQLQFAIVMGQALLQLLASREGDHMANVNPFFGITQTLIDRNEIIGGVGHGISVQGQSRLPELLFDLHISRNEIRGMAGAGILCNEYAMVVGLEVSGNQVADCGQEAGTTTYKNGIVLRNCAVSHVGGNQIERSGGGQSQFETFGADLDGIYLLRFDGNRLLANGSDQGSAGDGGLQLVEVYGSAAVNGNTFAFNRGISLSWVNSALPDEAALLPTSLIDAAGVYLKATRTAAEMVGEEQASVQGNVVQTAGDNDLPAVRLQNLTALSFSGNTCYGETTGVPLGEIQMVSRGVVAHNLLQTTAEFALSIKKMTQGIVIANMGNKPIQVQFSTVDHGYNVPSVSS